MTEYLFLSGKGGVGKTAMAAMTAVYNAMRGKKTLLISTDPASNLGDIFEKRIGHAITPILPNLSALDIDPDAAAEECREKIIGPTRGVMPDDIMKVLEEQFRSACTTEIAAVENAQRKLESLLGKLKDSATSAFMLVFDPEYTPIHEAKRTLDDLNLAGIGVQAVIANNVLENGDRDSDFFHRRAEMQQHYLEIAKKLFQLPVFKIPMFDDEISGLPKLKQVAESLFQRECCLEGPAWNSGEILRKVASDYDR